MSKGDIQSGSAYVRLFLKDELTRNIKRTMESAGKTMMIAGSAIVGPMVMAVKAAGDLEATVAKLGEVFKGRTPDVQAWGDELAHQIGRSKREVYDFLSATQDLNRRSRRPGYDDKRRARRQTSRIACLSVCSRQPPRPLRRTTIRLPGFAGSA